MNKSPLEAHNDALAELEAATRNLDAVAGREATESAQEDARLGYNVHPCANGELEAAKKLFV